MWFGVQEISMDECMECIFAIGYRAGVEASANRLSTFASAGVARIREVKRMKPSYAMPVDRLTKVLHRATEIVRDLLNPADEGTTK